MGDGPNGKRNTCGPFMWIRVIVSGWLCTAKERWNYWISNRKLHRKMPIMPSLIRFEFVIQSNWIPSFLGCDERRSVLTLYLPLSLYDRLSCRHSIFDAMFALFRLCKYLLFMYCIAYNGC